MYAMLYAHVRTHPIYFPPICRISVAPQYLGTPVNYIAPTRRATRLAERGMSIQSLGDALEDILRVSHALIPVL